MPRNREDTREQPGLLQQFMEMARRRQEQREENNPAREAERLERERHQREAERIQREAAQRRRDLEYEQRLQSTNMLALQQEYYNTQMRLMADIAQRVRPAQIVGYLEGLRPDPRNNTQDDHAVDAQRYYQTIELPNRQGQTQHFRRFERYAPITADNPFGPGSWENEVHVTTSPHDNVNMVEQTPAEDIDNPNRTRRIDRDELPV